MKVFSSLFKSFTGVEVTSLIGLFLSCFSQNLDCLSQGKKTFLENRLLKGKKATERINLRSQLSALLKVRAKTQNTQFRVDGRRGAESRLCDDDDRRVK